jgi:hypothetical protein
MALDTDRMIAAGTELTFSLLWSLQNACISKKLPPLLVSTGSEARALRLSLNRNQQVFWDGIGVRQSHGSRCEHLGLLKNWTAVLLHLTYGSVINPPPRYLTAGKGGIAKPWRPA